MDPGQTQEYATISDYLLAAGEDHDLAVVDGGRRYSYLDLREAAAVIADALLRLELPVGARIGLLGVNSFFWVAAYLAAMKVGVVVPFSEKVGVEELAAQADWVGCSAMLIDRRQGRRLAAVFGDRPVVTDAVLSGAAVGNWPSTSADWGSEAALMFTSGTTSRPKAVRITHANLLANTRSIIGYTELGPGDRMLVILPFHYCFGASLLHTHLAVGASIVICNTLAFPETAIELIRSEACTGLAGVPSSLRLLLRASSLASRPLPTLRLVQQAGGRMAPELVQQLARSQPQAKVFVMYGQTEATARLSYLPPELIEVKPDSIGRGIPGVELAVVGSDGLPVAAGEQGEIVASGANISPGYYNDPEATAEKFPGGQLRTGDLATVDDDGFITIVGRSGDFIKSWGYRVSPQQIEETALQFEGVGEAAVVGLPDPEAGEAVTLAVLPALGSRLLAEDLMAFLRLRLPKHMVPETIRVLTNLPLTASGKVAKPELRELLASLAVG